MVAIVSGMQAGLNLGSREVLGSSGLIGNALEGRNGQGVYVNVGNGLLVVQKQDDLLVSRGHDAAVLRTYNSGGVFNDDNGDNWASGVVSLRVAGVPNAVGSTVQRVDRDGSTATYAFDAARNLYVTTEGAGAHDSIGHVAADAQFEWRDGSTGATQRFEGSGQYRLLASRDASGVACTYAYGAGGFLSSVTTASGESTFYDYVGANLSQVRTVAGGVTNTRVRYGYDAANRLAAVTVDLTPGDNSVADGKVYQTTYAYDGTSRRIATIGQSDGTSLAFTYDNAGNVLGYVVRGSDWTVNKYTTALNRYEGYQAGVTNGTSTRLLSGSSTQHYDANGFLVGVSDTTQPKNNRSFVNDASGRALFVNQGGNIQRQMIVNGEMLGIYGVGVDPNKPVNGIENNPSFANLVDFDFGYSKITANYPNAAPGAYTIRTGDTLQSIAQSAFGDSALWYRIAEANGLSSNNDLRVGQTLNIPNLVGTVHNNNTTFKPYDPSRIEGDKSPNLPAPKPKKKNLFAQFLMVVIAIVVTLYTAGALSGFSGGFFQTMAAGANALAATGAAAGAASLGTTGAAVSAVAGSMASQLVGLGTGVVEDFDWKGVALSALSAGVSFSLPGTFIKELPLANVVVRSAIANAITQGIAVATGLQQKFQWNSVAASAVGAGVGQAVGGALGVADRAFTQASFGEQLVKRFATGMAAGLAAVIARGGKVVVQQVALDAFGNALGQSLAESATPSDPLGDFINEKLADQSRRDLAKRWDVPPTDYSLLSGGRVRLGMSGGAELQASPEEVQAAFRASEHEYRRSTDQSVAGTPYRARAGDSISRILGSSDPQAIGNFMRASGLTSDRIEIGRNYFVPGSVVAYGESAALGQFALNQGNERVARAATAQSDVAMRDMDARDIRQTFVYRSVLGRGLETAAALADAEARAQARIDSGPWLSARDVAGETRAAATLQRDRNNIAIAAWGPIVGGYMEGARLAGMSEHAVEQTGLQAAAFMDLYAPRGPSGVATFARVRGVRAAHGDAGSFGGVAARTPAEVSFLRNAAATFGDGSVFNTATRYGDNIVIQRSDIEFTTQNVRRMDAGASPFVKNSQGEYEIINLHHIGRQSGKVIEVLDSHNNYDPRTGGTLHIPGPGSPIRDINTKQYWRLRLETAINNGLVPESVLQQMRRN